MTWRAIYARLYLLRAVLVLVPAALVLVAAPPLGLPLALPPLHRRLHRHPAVAAQAEIESKV